MDLPDYFHKILHGLLRFYNISWGFMNSLQINLYDFTRVCKSFIRFYGALMGT